MRAVLGQIVVVALFACALAAQEERVRVSLEAAPAEPVVGQQAELTLLVEYDAAFFDDYGLPLLQRRMDVPFCVEFDRGDLAGLAWRDAAAGPSVVVNGREVRAAAAPVVATGDSSSRSLELTATWTASTVGQFAPGAPKVRYAFTTGFEQTLLGGRQPLDRSEVEVVGTGVLLRVRELPEEGRPEGFSGAIGNFTVHAEAPAAVEVGDSFTLELVVRGDGNLHRFAAPPWPELGSFVVQGMVEADGPTGRRFGFDVLALRAGAALPAVPFSFFDPSERCYRSVTAEIAVQVGARAPDRPLSPRVQRLIEQAGAEDEAGLPWWWSLVVGLPVLALLLLLLRRRRG